MEEILTKRQAQILELIAEHRARRGYSPTVREIAHLLGLSSVATVAEHISALEKKGLLRRLPNKARSVTLTRAGRSFLKYSHTPALSRGESPKSAMIPLLGVISAGLPIEALPIPEEIEVPSGMVAGRECFALKVKGKSMVGEGILDGDYVVVEKKVTAENGDTVVALINGEEVTLKKLRRYMEGGREKVRLEPANPQMEPIVLQEGDNLQIQGRVIGVIRLIESKT